MAALTTRTLVLNTAPELAAIAYPPAPGAPDEWGQALADVELSITQATWGAHTELAQRLWVAHVLTLQHPELERRQLTSMTMGGMTKSLAATQAAPASQEYWPLTRHGRRLQELAAGLFLAVGIT